MHWHCRLALWAFLPVLTFTTSDICLLPTAADPPLSPLPANGAQGLAPTPCMRPGLFCSNGGPVSDLYTPVLHHRNCTLCAGIWACNVMCTKRANERGNWDFKCPQAPRWHVHCATVVCPAAWGQGQDKAATLIPELSPDALVPGPNRPERLLQKLLLAPINWTT